MTEELGWLQAHQKWECVTVQGGALRDSVPTRPLSAGARLCLPPPGVAILSSAINQRRGIGHRGKPLVGPGLQGLKYISYASNGVIASCTTPSEWSDQRELHAEMRGDKRFCLPSFSMQTHTIDLIQPPRECLSVCICVCR